MNNEHNDERANVKCPHCSQDFWVDAVAVIPDEQKTTMTITYESPFTSAEAIGKAIQDYAKALKAVAKSSGVPVTVFVSNMTCATGSIAVEFLIAAIKPANVS